MLRRVLLNLFYLRSKTHPSGASEEDSYEQTSVVLGDYRVLAMMLLACSSVLQYHFHPFRKESENRLEMYSLQMLSIVIMIDYADVSQNGLVALASSFVFSLTLVVVSIKKQYTAAEREHKAKRLWQNVRAQSELFNIREHSDIVTKAGTISIDDADKTLWVGGIPDYMCAADNIEPVDPAAGLNEQAQAFREQMLISNLRKCLEGLDGPGTRDVMSTASTVATYGPFDIMKLTHRTGTWEKKIGTLSNRDFGYSETGRINVAHIRSVEAVDPAEEQRDGAEGGIEKVPARPDGTFQHGFMMSVMQKSGSVRAYWFSAPTKAERDEWVTQVRQVSWIDVTSKTWRAQPVVKTIKPRISRSVGKLHDDQHREHWAQPWHGHSWAMVTFQNAGLAQRAYDRGIFVPKEGASDANLETLESGNLSFKGAKLGMLPGKWLDRHLTGQYQGHYGVHENLQDHLHGLSLSRLQSRAVMYGATEDEVKMAVGCPATVSLKDWCTFDEATRQAQFVRSVSPGDVSSESKPPSGEEIKQALITLILEEAVFNTIKKAIQSNTEVFGES